MSARCPEGLIGLHECGVQKDRRSGQQSHEVTGSCSRVWIHTKNNREGLKAETETDMIILAF